MAMRFLLFVLSLFFALVFPSRPPSMYGQTPPSSESKPLSSQNSAEHLTTWNKLSEQFELTLKRHEETLTELSEKLKTSESSLEQSTLLLDTLSRQNEDLKNCNSQIGERMYQRDMDLLSAYNKISRLEKERFQMLYGFFIMGAGLIVGLVLFFIRR
jgi:Skp family chaperone for outer membrane proteins